MYRMQPYINPNIIEPMDQLSKINRYVEELVSSRQVGEDTQSMLLSVESNEIGGDNKKHVLITRRLHVVV